MKFFLQIEVNIQCLDAYFCKILEKFKEIQSQNTRNLRKKLRNFSLKTLEIKGKKAHKSCNVLWISVQFFL